MLILFINTAYLHVLPTIQPISDRTLDKSKIPFMIICLNQVENVKIKGQIVVNMDNKCAKHHTHHGPKKIVKNIVDFVEEVKVQNNFYIKKNI